MCGWPASRSGKPTTKTNRHGRYVDRKQAAGGWRPMCALLDLLIAIAGPQKGEKAWNDKEAEKQDRPSMLDTRLPFGPTLVYFLVYLSVVLEVA